MKDGGPAFPIVGMQDRGGQGILAVFNNGMSLRDWFAGQALAGALASLPPQAHYDADMMAVASYCTADAMLKAREQP